MKILEGIEIIDLALWLNKEKTLIVSDFHLGYEEVLKKEGVFVPRFQLKDVLERLKIILEKVKPEKIIINGDLKHEFGKVLNQEWRDVLRLLDFLIKNSNELILVKGNHDLFLSPIAGKRNIKIVDDYLINDILITHGNKIKKTKANTLIIGHEHPAISLKEEGKIEKYKCFLKGKWERKNLIITPSFNFLFEGTDITKEELLSPYLKDVSDFEVYVIGKKVYNFGKLKDLTP